MSAPPPYPEYPELLAAARASLAADGGFLDPVKMLRATRIDRDWTWRIAVLGHDRSPGELDIHLMLLADERGVEPPLPTEIVAARAAAAAKEKAERDAWAAVERAIDAEWTALVAEFPVPVTVAYNYSGGNHLDGYEQGAVHALLCDELRTGRLHRKAGEALCTTPSNRRRQHFADGGDLPDKRPATCKACLTVMCRVTGLAAPTLLAHTRGRGR